MPLQSIWKSIWCVQSSEDPKHKQTAVSNAKYRIRALPTPHTVLVGTKQLGSVVTRSCPYGNWFFDRSFATNNSLRLHDQNLTESPYRTAQELKDTHQGKESLWSQAENQRSNQVSVLQQQHLAPGRVRTRSDPASTFRSIPAILARRARSKGLVFAVQMAPLVPLKNCANFHYATMYATRPFSTN